MPNTGLAHSGWHSLTVGFHSLYSLLSTLFFFFFFFRATHAAYGGSQARGPVGAVAPGLPTAMPDLSCVWDLCYSSAQWIFNPLKEFRDGTCILMVTRQILYP